jgi:hypothetical protein
MGVTARISGAAQRISGSTAQPQDRAPNPKDQPPTRESVRSLPKPTALLKTSRLADSWRREQKSIAFTLIDDASSLKNAHWAVVLIIENKKRKTKQ